MFGMIASYSDHVELTGGRSRAGPLSAFTRLPSFYNRGMRRGIVEREAELSILAGAVRAAVGPAWVRCAGHGRGGDRQVQPGRGIALVPARRGQDARRLLR